MYDSFMLESMFGLLKDKDSRDQRFLKIWSAGCSSGEETYTIAIIILELLGKRIKDYMVKIIGTDIDTQALAMAKKGIYSSSQFSETAPDILLNYFSKADGTYEVKPEVKALVEFQESDLMAGIKPRNLDVIFCRNVIIYFSQEAKEKLFMEFCSCLNTGGYLVLGKTETLIGPAKEKLRLVNTVERIYLKESAN
jgi:chemotaxis protein methyltransferase CheR